MKQLIIFVLAFCTLRGVVGATQQYVTSCTPRRETTSLDHRCTLTLLAVTDSPTNCTIQTFDGTTTVSLSPGEPYVYNIDVNYYPFLSTDRAGVLITSTDEINVYLARRDTQTSIERYVDATQIYPITADQSTYEMYLSTHEGGIIWTSLRKHFFVITAIEDNTSITLYSDAEVVDKTINLDGLWTYFQSEVDPELNYNGYRVVSDKPISVLCGTLHAFSNYGTSLIASSPPVEQLGTRYWSPPIGGPATGEDGSLVSVTATEYLSSAIYGPADDIRYLHKSEWFSYETDDQLMTGVECNLPCVVAQYTKNDYYNVAGGAMFNLLPQERFYPTATFTTIDFNEEVEHYLGIVVEGSDAPAEGALLLDGEPLVGVEWETLKDAASGTAIRIDVGAHTLRAAEGSGVTFAAYVYGHPGESEESDTGYGYTVLPPAGDNRY